jgi:hypothetical protein
MSSMIASWTRRDWALSLAALAQTPPAVPADELAAYREQLHRISAQLAKFDLRMSVEPAFQFKP